MPTPASRSTRRPPRRKLPAPPPAWRRLHDKSARELLATEVRTLRATRAAVRALSAVLRWADDPKRSLVRAVADTDAPNDRRLRRLAATHTARAYNDEHDEAEWAALAEHEDAAWFPLVFKRWDALLDAKICPTC